MLSHQGIPRPIASLNSNATKLQCAHSNFSLLSRGFYNLVPLYPFIPLSLSSSLYIVYFIQFGQIPSPQTCPLSSTAMLLSTLSVQLRSLFSPRWFSSSSACSTTSLNCRSSRKVSPLSPDLLFHFWCSLASTSPFLFWHLSFSVLFYNILRALYFIFPISRGVAYTQRLRSGLGKHFIQKTASKYFRLGGPYCLYGKYSNSAVLVWKQP